MEHIQSISNSNMQSISNSIRLFDMGTLSSGGTDSPTISDISEADNEENADTTDSLYIDDENTAPNTKINLVKGKN